MEFKDRIMLFCLKVVKCQAGYAPGIWYIMLQVFNV